MRNVLVFLMVILVASLTAQVNDVSGSIGLNLTAPQVLIDRIAKLNVYLEQVAHGAPYNLRQDMTLAQLNALNPTPIQTTVVDGLPVQVQFLIPADGGDLIVGALPLDAAGVEISGTVAPNVVGYLKTSVSPATQVPYIPTVTDVYYYMTITINFGN